MSVNCECLRRMEQDVAEVLPMNKRKDFVAPITDLRVAFGGASRGYE